MKVSVLAVGKMKAGPEHDLYARFSSRIQKSGKALHFSDFQTVEIPESRKQSAIERKDDEAETLLSKIAQGSKIIMLDEHGKDFDSQSFAKFLKSEQDDGAQNLCFVIGGPDGHGEQLKKAASKTIRLGAMTWPHQIARILLAEQIYRAITILSGHPYHRE